PDPTDPTYNNGGNAHGSGSSGGTASASDGNVSVDISFDGVHNRLDAVNDNLAGTNERIETTNNLLNDFSNRHDQNSKKTRDAIGDLNSDLGKKLDSNGKQISDALGGLGDKLDDISDGSNTTASDSGCGVSDFSCDGNSYECYVARTNWKNKCLMSSLTGDPLVPHEGVPIESSQQVSESGDALINDLKGYSSQHLDPDKLSNGDVLITDSLDKFNESNGLSFDEKCPAPNVVDTGMGVFTIDYTPFCDLALYVRAMLMLFASIGSILMISKFS
ncbi:virulence factor TspB C-terminal domain-related protein, partial [Vibrio splendidus]|uniref:virulence factor TspB C-terminal domain-related protein n=1 Tax=Vibrio splendidus TaxID=29497 RepID=UPI0013001568